jgi:hypothetical protein
MTKRRRGMALAVTIGVVSLIAILAVATLSLAGRLVQNSTLGLRDARLDAGVGYGLGAATAEWRARHLGRLAIGASISFDARPHGIPISVTVVVTRIADDLFWVASEATAEGGAVRRENLILRAHVPDAQSLLADDSTDVGELGSIAIDSLAADADSHFPPGATIAATDGVVHVDGNATLTGGAGRGILIVDGRLTITGQLTYEGIIVARDGVSVVASGVSVAGLIRAGGSPSIAGNHSFSLNAAVAQDVLLQSLTPSAIAGRRWAEMP